MSLNPNDLPRLDEIIAADQARKEREAAARQQAIKKALAEGVKKGLITQEEADWLFDKNPRTFSTIKNVGKEVKQDAEIPF